MAAEQIDRIKKAVEKNSRFLETVFSPEEIDYFNRNGKRYETLAGFFAAKEAFSKYLGTGLRGISLKEISVCHTESGMPYILFQGSKQKASLTISHNKSCAVATVCGESILSCTNDCYKEMKSLLPMRNTHCHKGDFGRVLVIAGSEGMVGAAVLSAYSALRSGCGLVTLATCDSERAVAASFHPEIMTAGLLSENGQLCRKALPQILKLSKTADAVVFGPGLGQNGDIGYILEELLISYKGKMVIDADGLNALSHNPDILLKRSCDLVLTPHPGEMSRLTKLGTEEIQKNRKKIAKEFAEKYGICLVLKGTETVVAQPMQQTYTNCTGNPGMATAGSGDVLSGVIAALVAQGLTNFDAARLGVYVHGLAGDIAAQKKGVYGLIAGDISEELPKALSEIANQP